MRKRFRNLVLLVAGLSVALGGAALAASPAPVPYTPPCTANTDACRQSRIVALESFAAGHEGRIRALETPAPSATTPPATTTVPPVSPSPTVTTPAPTTAPPAATGWPNASTTGVPAGTTLTAYSGPTTISVAGTVISDKLITSCLRVTAPNVSILRSKIACEPGRDGTAVIGDSTGLIMTDVEVDGNPLNKPPSTCGIAIGYDHYTLLRVHVHGCSDGLRAGGVVSVTDSLVDGLWASDGDHADGIQAYQGAGDMTFRHNTVDGRTQNRCCETAPIFIADGYTGTVTVEDNWFAGGGYSLRFHENGRYVVTGNRVLAASYTFGPVTTVNGIIQTWSNNREISASGVDGVLIEP